MAASDMDRAGPHTCGTVGTPRHWPASSRSFPFCTIDEDPPPVPGVPSRVTEGTGSDRAKAFSWAGVVSPDDPRWVRETMEGEPQNGPRSQAPAQPSCKGLSLTCACRKLPGRPYKQQSLGDSERSHLCSAVSGSAAMRCLGASSFFWLKQSRDHGSEARPDVPAAGGTSRSRE